MKQAINRGVIISIVATFAALTVIGVLRSYSPIPEGDDWISYLGFYADLLDGKDSAWFAPDGGGNRPILSRLLIWLDIRYFGGRFVFLIAANFALLCGIIAMLMAYLKRLTNERSMQFVIGATICIAAVSWIQFANLISGNGLSIGNFFLALLLPLIAFYWLAQAQKQQSFFWLALIAGFASAGTMGNGILVLPLLAMLALYIGLKPGHTATLVIASALTIALYFHSPDDQSSVLGTYLSTLTGNPIGVAQYTLTFLGNPFYYVAVYPLAVLQFAFLLVAGQAPRQVFAVNGLDDYPIANAIGLYIAQAAGVFLFATAMIALRRWLASGREATRGALIAFIFFIILTAAACAAGRFIPDLGSASALEFRYTTPPLFGWIALILLISPSFDMRRAVCVFVCAAILLLPKQLVPVFGLGRVAVEHERSLQAMQAVLHGSDDRETLRILHSDDPDLVRRVARRLRGTKISIFADGP